MNDKWHETEKAALVGDKDAALWLVSGFRRYRALVEDLLSSRYRDGAVDGAKMHEFKYGIMSVDDDFVGDNNA